MDADLFAEVVTIRWALERIADALEKQNAQRQTADALAGGLEEYIATVRGECPGLERDNPKLYEARQALKAYDVSRTI